jgi:GNAT superfamily N-acetyltransferase
VISKLLLRRGRQTLPDELSETESIAMSAVHVRLATAEDAAIIVELVRELATYEKQPPAAVKLTEADVVRDGFGAPRRFEVLLAEHDGRVEGYALIFSNYSTWEGRAGIYIEDLFVRERARGIGLGRRLLVAIAELAVERGCPRIDLNVLDWNPTREFYHRIGIVHLTAWLPYRISGEAIVKLARDSAD